MAGNQNSGRRPLPSALTVIQGGRTKRVMVDGKRRKVVIANEPKPPQAVTVPRPPSSFYPPKGSPDEVVTYWKEAREHWDKMAKALHAMGILTIADMNMFEMLCTSWADWRQASRKRNVGYWIADFTKPKPTKQGDVQQYEVMKNPYLRIEVESAKKYRMCAQEFGLSPSSRVKVGATGTPPPAGNLDDQNPFNEFRLGRQPSV